MATSAVWPRNLTSQLAPSVVVAQVVDSAGTPIFGAVVDAVGDNDSTVATGRTDSLGLARLSIPSRMPRWKLRARKLGYQAAERTIDVAADRITPFKLVLSRSVQQLAAVRTTEAQTLLRQRYHIDADAIANSGAVLIDSFDILAKLRPDIVWGRGNCGGAVNVWVNGRWIPPELVIQNDIATARAKSGGASSKVSKAVLHALTLIPPEDVAEMTYLDCRDTSLGSLHAQNALFVILKSGLQFDPGSGVKRVVAGVAVDSTRTRDARPASLILGIFHSGTGDPIVDAVVRDSISGASALTTTTGTVSLVFVEPQDTIIAIHKSGYRDTVIVVPRSRSLPITIVLRKN